MIPILNFSVVLQSNDKKFVVHNLVYLLKILKKSTRHLADVFYSVIHSHSLSLRFHCL